MRPPARLTHRHGDPGPPGPETRGYTAHKRTKSPIPPQKRDPVTSTCLPTAEAGSPSEPVAGDVRGIACRRYAHSRGRPGSEEWDPLRGRQRTRGGSTRRTAGRWSCVGTARWSMPAARSALSAIARRSQASRFAAPFHAQRAWSPPRRRAAPRRARRESRCCYRVPCNAPFGWPEPPGQLGTD